MMRSFGTAVLLGLSVVGVWVFVPLASGWSPACTITNQATGQTYARLQPAVNVASVGDTLLVRGTCTGTTTVGIDLNLRGQRRGPSGPTLDAGGTGVALTINDSSSVAIDSLMITGGTSGGIVIGAGGMVMLDHSTVSGNNGVFGGGIANNGGTLIVDNSRVSNNTATVDGGGIDTYPVGAIIVLGDSTIDHNTAELNGGGISNFDSATVSVRDSASVSGNTAFGSGGGIYNSCDHAVPCTGGVTLRNASRLYNNAASGTGTPPGNGGGISNGGGASNQAGLTVTMSDGSRIYSNTAAQDGGGIFNNHGTLNRVVPGTNVRRNSPDDVS
jgi:predicted outer membrane repeat protein